MARAVRRSAHGFVALAVASLALVNCAIARADGLFEALVDPHDHKFDVSQWLLERKGFLPVPIVITEPAVGYGGGIALVFFRESIADSARKSSGGQVTAPDIYGGGVAATENGTRVAGIGALLHFKDDRWRYRGGIGYADVNLDFYGIGGDLGTGDRKIGYNLQGSLSSQQVLRRLGASNQWLGARWLWLDLDSRFDSDRPEPILDDAQVSRRSSALGLSWEFDTRDNIFTPSRGFIAAVETLFYDPAWGSDESFQSYRARFFGYLPVGREFVIGARLDGRTVHGDVPFYQLPYIVMRGIPAARYQDENVAVVETEVRWNATPRWALVGYIGAGRAWGRNDDFGEADSEVAKGGGFRYLIARRLGLYVGMDYGWGPDDEALYLQVGSAWR